MRWTSLVIAKGSHRSKRCSGCRRAITLATLARPGAKTIALVASPIVLREEQQANRQ